MFKVEKGIPIPSKPSLYPFDKMEVGDSFLIACSEEEKYTMRNRAICAAWYERKKTKARYTVGTVAEGIRVWRYE